MPLVDELISDGWLKSPHIIEAFKTIKRADFLPDDLKELTEFNEALAIGYGQTISQPLVVAFMLEQLQPQPGDKILDVGSGSGWTTALLAEIVGSKGKVIAIEVIPELMEFGKKNVERYNFIEKGVVEFICADGSKGYPKHASRPELAEGFDKILCSASAPELSPAWKEQLKIGGRIVTPMGSSIWLFIKNPPAGEEKDGFVFEEIEYPGFVFVPLITGR